MDGSLVSKIGAANSALIVEDNLEAAQISPSISCVRGSLEPWNATGDMKAIVLTRYGGPDDLELRNVLKPCPEDGEVLIKVHAAAVNDWDWGLVRGKPVYIRLLGGLLAPKIPIIGCDVAGRIEAVGRGVTDLEVGDDVYGDLSESGFGAFAEYVCAHQDAVVPMPRTLTYEQAAAIPHAAMLAQQGLDGVARIAEAQTLLVNGAGGGVGTVAVQLAKYRGVEVTGVDSTDKQDFLRSAGFDHVIDYTEVDFTGTGQTYDVILDAKTDRSPFAYARALKAGGTYVTVGGTIVRLVQCLLLRRWIARTRSRHVRVLGLKPNEGLERMTELLDAGKVMPTIDSTYPLNEVPQAIRRFGEARHKGKIVVTVAS